MLWWINEYRLKITPLLSSTFLWYSMLGHNKWKRSLHYPYPFGVLWLKGIKPRLCLTPLSQLIAKGKGQCTCIERFHSCGQHLCKCTETRESVNIRKEFNSHRIDLEHQQGRHFIVLEHQNGRSYVIWKRSIHGFIRSRFCRRRWPCNVVLNIESANEISNDDSNESYWAVLFCGTV